MAGVAGTDPDIVGFLATGADQEVLGKALDPATTAEFRAGFLELCLQHSPFTAQMAGTCAMAAYVGQDDVGLAMAGPSARLLQHTLAAVPDRTVVRKILVGSAKLQILAVDPALRGSGAGSRLLNETINTFIANRYRILYGQFATSEQEMLEPFYRKHGFEVLTPGEGLDLGELLGVGTEVIGTGPSSGETMIFRRLRH